MAKKTTDPKGTKGGKARFGRHRLPTKERRTLRFPVNLNQEEKDFIFEAAGRQTPLAWGRLKLLAAAEEALGRKLPKK